MHYQQYENLQYYIDVVNSHCPKIDEFGTTESIGVEIDLGDIQSTLFNKRNPSVDLAKLDTALGHWRDLHIGCTPFYLLDHPFVFLNTLLKIICPGIAAFQGATGKEKAVLDTIVISGVRQEYLISVAQNANHLKEMVDSISKKFGVKFNNCWVNLAIIKLKTMDSFDGVVDDLGDTNYDLDILKEKLLTFSTITDHYPAYKCGSLSN